MKKLFLLILLVVFCLAVGVSCGDDDDDDNDDATPDDDDDDATPDDDDATPDDDDATPDDDDATPDDDTVDDDTVDDDTVDDDTVDDDTGDDDTAPYWADGEDLGAVAPEVYRPIVDQGLSAWEWDAGMTAVEALLQSDSIMWVATLDADTGLYYLWHQDGELTFSRTIGDDGLEFTIESQIGPDPFPSQDPMLAAGYDAEIALLENPEGIQMTEHGYETDDPRVGWIPLDQYSYPDALKRIAQIFDSPNGPDIALDEYPWHGGGTGTHGNLGVMQSRATLLLAGAGITPGEVIVDAASLADVAPTTMALLGADPVEGVDARGHRVTNNMLLWQDGRVLVEAMTDPSVQGLAEQVVVLLFDGLAPNELYYHYENQGGAGWDLPNFFELIDNGTFYQGGAVVGWPSVSWPGHTMMGGGVYQGRHGVLVNDNWDRETGFLLSFNWFFDHFAEILADPTMVLDVYNIFYHEEREIENIFQAAHRAFGDWDLLKPWTWKNAYTACVNELTFVDADYGPYALLEIASAIWPDAAEFDPTAYYLADLLAPIQSALILTDPTHEAPKVSLISFYVTDHIGEAHGPHSDFLREELLLMDRYVGQIIDQYKNAGLYESTAFIVVSDHGMELLKPGSFDPWAPYVNAAGVRYRTQMNALMYLMVMRLLPDQTEFVAGQEATFTVTVTNDDNAAAVEGATLTLTGGTCQPCQETTDANGEATFTVTPSSGEDLELTGEHADFTASSMTLTVVDP